MENAKQPGDQNPSQNPPQRQRDDEKPAEGSTKLHPGQGESNPDKDQQKEKKTA